MVRTLAVLVVLLAACEAAASPTPEPTATGEQAVLVYLRLSDDGFGTAEERKAVFDLEDRLIEAVTAELRNWPVGDPLDPATKIGALISRGHMERVLGYIAAGRDEGARVVTGGQQILRESGLNFTVANGMKDAAEKVVALSGHH